jgi:hypothetical protein
MNTALWTLIGLVVIGGASLLLLRAFLDRYFPHSDDH